MMRVIHTHLTNQHRNRQYKLHLQFKKFPIKDEAINNPSNGIIIDDWVNYVKDLQVGISGFHFFTNYIIPNIYQ